MKLGVIGLSGSGKTTIFEALTGVQGGDGHSVGNRIGTIAVPDKRVEFLAEMYQPKKTVLASVEYFLPSRAISTRSLGGVKDDQVWTEIRSCDALVHVVRNFVGIGGESPTPAIDCRKIEEELILADLGVVEKRLERIELDRKRGKNVDQEEADLLGRCIQLLESETPLRMDDAIAASPKLRGYCLLSSKPMLVLINNADEDQSLPDGQEFKARQDQCVVIQGKIERELALMSEADAKEFLAEYEIEASARDRVIQKSYALLGLISFFTVGEDEVRAWTIRMGMPAADAAGAIHSDIKKGFIRAEVLAYADLLASGSYQEARKAGTVRLEGKTYLVADGDIMNFRFNV